MKQTPSGPCRVWPAPVEDTIIPVNRLPNLTPDRRAILTPVAACFGGSDRAVGAGRGCGDGASAGCRVIVGSAFEAPAVVAGLDDVAVVGQAIEQRGCHLGSHFWGAAGRKAPNSGGAPDVGDFSEMPPGGSDHVIISERPTVEATAAPARTGWRQPEPGTLKPASCYGPLS